MRKIYRDGELIEVSDDYVLKDGERLNVGSFFMDAALVDADDTEDERPAAVWRLVNPMLKDASPTHGVSMTDAERQMQDAYQQGIRDLNAWRGEGSRDSTTVADATTEAEAYQQGINDLNAWRREGRSVADTASGAEAYQHDLNAWRYK